MVSTSLRRFFAAPHFLALPAAGIDISDRAIKFVECRRTPFGVRVHNYGKLPIPEKTLQRGQILNPQGLVDALSGLEEHIATRFVNVSLPEEQAFLFSTTVPHMKAEAIRDSLSLQMERFVPIPLKDVIFDFDVVAMRADAFEVQVVAIDRKTVYAYLDVFHKVGLEVVLFEIEPQSASRALLPKEHSETTLVVDFGDTQTGISIVEGGYVLFTTTSDITGNKIKSTIARGLGISPVAAEEIKCNYGVLPHEKNKLILSDIEAQIIQLSKDIQKAIQYWQSQSVRGKGQQPHLVARVLFCGGNTYMPGLLAKLQELTAVPIEKGDPWIRIRSEDNQYAPVIPPDEALGYSTAIGLAIAGISHD